MVLEDEEEDVEEDVVEVEDEVDDEDFLARLLGLSVVTAAVAFF